MTSVALNQATFEAVETPAFLEAAVDEEVREVGLWRHKLAPWGAGGMSQLAERAGIEVTSLCRGGFFTAPSQTERSRAVADTCAAIKETAALPCPTPVLVCGPAADGDLPGARATIARAADRIATLQLADWPVSMGVPLRGRALPGHGVAPLAEIVALVLAAGYDGPVEVEVLSEDVWARPAHEVARTARERTEHVIAAARAQLTAAGDTRGGMVKR
jgi:sugar phosphate isomerase/epimerase